MMSNHSLIVAPTAAKDIRSILRATLLRWGAVQRDAYEGHLTAALDRLVQFPELGQRADHISLGLRSHRIGQHVIYYRVSDQTIRIVRLLHVKMDTRTQFEVERS